MMKSTRTKKQHYIAQGIIKAFFDSSNIYEKNIHSGKVFPTSVNNTMCMNNSYETSLLDDNFLEDLFAISIDEDSSKLIKRLKIELEDDKFISAKNMIYKNIRIFLINYYKSVASLIHMSADMSKKDQESIIRMINTIFNIPYIDRISEILCTGYDFTIIKSKEGSFALSDQFISTCALKFVGKFINISNREIGLKNTIVLIPISKNYYGMFVNGDLPDNFNLSLDSINELNWDQTQIINDVIYNNCYEKCISLDKNELDRLEKKKSTFGDLMAFANFASGKSASFKIKQEVFFTDDEYEMHEYFNQYRWGDIKFKNCRVNELCPCGSNKKYKKCCRDKVERCKRVSNTMHYQGDNLMINKNLGFEDPIQLSNYEQSELQRKFEFLKK